MYVAKTGIYFQLGKVHFIRRSLSNKISNKAIRKVIQVDKTYPLVIETANGLVFTYINYPQLANNYSCIPFLWQYCSEMNHFSLCPKSGIKIVCQKFDSPTLGKAHFKKK